MVNSVAIISDVVMKYGGAEKVLDSFLEMYPNSTLFTLFIVPAARKRILKNFPNVKVKTSLFQIFIWSDYISRYISVIKIFSWIYWEILDLSKYDLILSLSHSYMSKNVKKCKKSFHLSYICTSPRFLYYEYNEIGLIHIFPLNLFFWPIKKILQFVDKRGSCRPDVLLTDSVNVQKRIKKYYGLDSIVVYPPVDEFLCKKQNIKDKKDYYVSISRLVKQKGIELAVITCRKMNRKLVVIGGGDEYEFLKKIGGNTTNFVGRCDDRKKYELISGAKALIYTSFDEDFGIVPVESLKAGVPVIAINSGGVAEVVIDNINGVFFNDRSVDSLSDAINRFEKLNFQKDVCIESVKKFGKEKFKNEILKIINNEKI